MLPHSMLCNHKTGIIFFCLKRIEYKPKKINKTDAMEKIYGKFPGANNHNILPELRHYETHAGSVRLIFLQTHVSMMIN
jgi:hypothetical protein